MSFICHGRSNVQTYQRCLAEKKKKVYYSIDQSLGLVQMLQIQLL